MAIKNNNEDYFPPILFCYSLVSQFHHHIKFAELHVHVHVPTRPQA